MEMPFSQETLFLSYINTLFESIAADNKTQGMVESIVLSQA